MNGQAADPSLAFDYPNPNLSVSGSCGAADSMSMGANDNPWTVGIGSYNSSEGLADVVHDGFAYGLLDNLVVSENRQ